MNTLKSTGFFFGLIGMMVGTAMLLCGLEERNRLSAFDDECESVSLTKFVQGEYQNKHWFELSGFRPADYYYSREQRYSSRFEYSWVPLYASNQEEDQGQTIRVIAKVVGPEDDQTLYDLLDQGRAEIQYWDNAPAESRELSKVYPQIDWSNVKYVNIGNDLPTESGSILWFACSGLAFGLGAIAWVTTAYLLIRAKRVANANYQQDTDQVQSPARNSSGYADRPNTVDPFDHSSLTQAAGANQRSRHWFKFAGFLSSASVVLILFNISVVVVARMGLINESISMWILYVTGPLFLLSAVGGIAIRFLVPPGFEIERVERDAVPAKILNLFEVQVREFLPHGYQMLGYAKTSIFDTKWNAFLLSNDRQKLVELTASKDKLAISQMGIATDGTVCLVGLGEAEISIDPNQIEVPYIGLIQQQISNRDIRQQFSDLSAALSHEGLELVNIRPEDVFHVMHYESILAAWWAYKSSYRFAKPEPVPNVVEVVQICADQSNFAFRRIAEISNAFESCEVDLPETTNPQTQLHHRAANDVLAKP